ncbi:MAG: NUDIX hydrolase, partial [Acidobacteriota bacterium]|nr:NUDIX hydrolase [Acidobacteriota bacterium]
MPNKVKPAKPASKKSKTAKIASRKAKAAVAPERARLLSSVVTYDGPLFRVHHDKLIEPGGKHSERDVIRHNGSVVILAIDRSKNKK